MDSVNALKIVNEGVVSDQVLLEQLLTNNRRIINLM